MSKQVQSGKSTPQVKEFMEILIFGAYLQLSCIEEMLTRASKQNTLLIRVKKKCNWLLALVLEQNFIQTREATTFFELRFKNFVSRHCEILHFSTLNLLSYKFGRYRSEYFHFSQRDDYEDVSEDDSEDDF